MTEYKVHVVTEDVYGKTAIGDYFKDGMLVNGFTGLGDDQLLIVAVGVKQCFTCSGDGATGAAYSGTDPTCLTCDGEGTVPDDG